MRLNKTLRTLLCSILFFVQCLICMDVAHNCFAISDLDEPEISDSTLLSKKSMPLAEELDGQEQSPVRRRVVMVANSLTLKVLRSVEPQKRVVQFASCNDAENARIVSWLDKERLHIQGATRSKPLWLRLQTLLI
ncbi:MAG: hypothetical protein K2Z81_04820 [Cyanobacteria bacterium]|nr:hypothetical protein [Cyanobacteriota bacterium]